MDINTDSETVYPPGGQIREYNLVVSAGRLAPDGVETDVLMINGSIPGPTLYADWGDTFVSNPPGHLFGWLRGSFILLTLSVREALY